MMNIPLPTKRFRVKETFLEKLQPLEQTGSITNTDIDKTSAKAGKETENINLI